MRRMLRRLVRNTGFSRRIAPNFAEVCAANQIGIVLDVGANDGGYGRELRDSGYSGCIHSFEPNPSAFKRLSASIAKDSLWSAVPYGVGQETGSLDLNISEADVFSSFKELNDFGAKSDNAKVVDTVEAKVVRLDDYLTEHPELLARPYLKIDTQGFEREVLEGLGNMLHEMIAIQVETSLVDSYVGETDWLESMQYMRDAGYEVATMVCNSSIPSKARVREFDIVYVRKDA